MSSLFTAAEPSRTPIPVSALANLIADAVGTLPGGLVVEGEISNLTTRSHWYFTLKDAVAQVGCVMWQSKTKGMRFVPKDGDKVLVVGRLDYWVAGGRLNFVAERMEPAGQGALELELRRRLEHYRAKGWFAPELKKTLPLLPRGVAVVTSRTGAALQDVLATARKRWPGCRIFLGDVRVQGASATGEIARMLEQLGRCGPSLGIEVVILTRGGGSIEDLWAFNEPEVIEAVHACPLPVVAAIGHETDTTIAEWVADLRCSTPTQAAMAVVPDVASLHQRFDPLAHRLWAQAHREVKAGAQRLALLARQPFLRDPVALIPPARRRVTEAEGRLLAAALRRTQRARERTEARARHLAAVAPERVLERGYSLTFAESGQLLRRAGDAIPGMLLQTRLPGGAVVSRVVDQPLKTDG